MKYRNFAITGGNFTDNGNFSGYNTLGERLHIHKRQMEAIGWKEQEDVVFPFFAIGGIKQIGQLDENGEPKVNEDGSAVLVDRLTATAVFKTREALVTAHVDEATLELDIKVGIAGHAKSKGLNEKAIDALLAAAI